MSTELRLRQTAPPDSSFSTSPGMAGDVDHQLDSLHRSRPVYKCDVFNHSATAGIPLPFQACLSQSFTEKPVVWVSKETVPFFPQRAFHHCRTSHRPDIPVKQRINTHTTWRRCQPSPPMAMQDLCRSPSYRQKSEFENREHAESPLTGAEWPGTSFGFYNSGQQHAVILPEPHLLYGEEPLNLETPTVQGNMLGRVSGSWWDISTHGIGHQPDLQHSQGEESAQDLVNSNAVPSLLTFSSEPSTLPPTPPSSTRGEGASPTGEAARNHQDVMNDAPQAGFDRSTSLLSGPLIPKRDQTVQSASQYLSAEMTWSDEEFARFLESDPFVADLNSFDNGSAEQPLLDSAWDHQTPVPLPNTGQPYSQNQQGPWENSVLSQLGYSNTYPSMPSHPFDQANLLVNSNVTVPSYKFGTTQQSLQPAVFTATSSLFDGLSPDIDLPTVGRRSGAKAYQRATAKDRELIEWKKHGLSYKEIKARGGFDEAESTLRGRYRTLTKPKHLRVRKPEWQQRDVRIVHQTWQA